MPAARGQPIPDLIRLAMEARQRGDLTAAAAIYDRIVRLDPASAELWANRGILLYEAGRYQAALDSLARSAKLKPSLAGPPLYSGRALLRLNRPFEAKPFLRRAVTLDPRNLDAVLELADACATTKAPGEAADLYERVLRERPAAAVWHRLGVLCLRWAKRAADELPLQSPYRKVLLADYQHLLGDAAKARELLQEAVRASPASADLRVRLADLLLTTDAAAAAVEISEARRIAPSNSRVLDAECRLRLRQSDSTAGGRCPQRDSEDFRTLDAIAKRRALTATESLRMGEAAWALREFAKARNALPGAFGLPRGGDYARYLFSGTCRELAKQAFDNVVRQDPDSYLAHLVQAEAAESSGDNVTAIREYERLLEKDSSDPGQHLNFIRVLAAQRDLTRAREAGAVAVKQFPDSAGINAQFGLVLLEAGSHQEAIPYLEKALAGDAGLAIARAGLANAYAAQGDFRRAITEIVKALPSDKDGSLHYRLGRWYRETGQDALADRAFAESERQKQKSRSKAR